MAHFGTYNGNPLVMAAAAAVDEICTREALDAAEALNNRTARRDRRDHRRVRAAGPHGRLRREGLRHLVDRRRCATTATTRRTDFGVAELSWLWGVNRGILTPPGLDEQWLVSLAHTQDDMDHLVSHFHSLAKALRD